MPLALNGGRCVAAANALYGSSGERSASPDRRRAGSWVLAPSSVEPGHVERWIAPDFFERAV
jgi:hypothetical protein